jgi:hypothetical protein
MAADAQGCTVAGMLGHSSPTQALHCALPEPPTHPGEEWGGYPICKLIWSLLESNFPLDMEEMVGG